MNDAFDRAWELTKAFPNMEYWHGTTADAARQILDEGLEAWSFGADDPDDPEMYSLDRMEARNEAPAMLAFDTTPEHTIHDPKEQGYDIGSEHGHWLVEEPVSPENVRLFAMGSKDMDGDEWIRFLDMLRAADRLSYRYPDIDEAYANRAVQKAWELIKAPWDIDPAPNTDYGYEAGKLGEVAGPLYSGGDRIHDDFTYWTTDKEKALAYALFGSAIPTHHTKRFVTEGVPMRETYPAIKVAPDPGVDENGRNASFVTEDPQSRDYIQDQQEGMNAEFMDEGELFDWISSLIPDPMNEKPVDAWGGNRIPGLPLLGTSAKRHGRETITDHMEMALNRLQRGASGHVALPDALLPHVSTSRSDNLHDLSLDEMEQMWREGLFEEWEKDYIRLNKRGHWFNAIHLNGLDPEWDANRDMGVQLHERRG